MQAGFGHQQALGRGVDILRTGQPVQPAVVRKPGPDFERARALVDQEVVVAERDLQTAPAAQPPSKLSSCVIGAAAASSCPTAALA